MTTKNMYDETVCSICGLPFTNDEWEKRHYDADGEDCHKRCCPICNELKSVKEELAVARQDIERLQKELETANIFMETYRDALAEIYPYPIDDDGDNGPCRFCRRGYFSKHAKTCVWAMAAGEGTA